jgi:hypothetical protein
MDMRFGVCNVINLYRAGSLMRVSEEISKYKLDLVGVQIRWDRFGTKPEGEYTFFYEKGNEDHEFDTRFLFCTQEKHISS